MTERALAIQRRRQSGLEAAADARPGTTNNCAPALVAVTYTKVSYPTAAGSYYACHPVRVGGTENEGSTVTTTPDSSQTVYAANLGSAIPPGGTTVLLTMTGGRWEFVYNA